MTALAADPHAYLQDQGAHFHRCDLQIHTPRDAQWTGKKAKTEAERQAYAAEFVAECRRIGLHAVAITDHHDLLFAPIIRAAAQAELAPDGQPYPAKERLTVFPGVELTLALSRQALLILDADFPDDRLPTVLEALSISVTDADVSTLPDVVALDHINSLAELHKQLDTREWLRGKYIVLPNVTDNGHKTIMRKGMHAEYKDMPCVGGYVDGSYDEKTGTGNRKIFAGENGHWGNKPLAVIQTSDSRNRNFSTLGQPSTWLKWAEPTAEALRQACLGRQSRISHTPPQLPSVFISDIQVSNSKFLGPVDLALNPQYNAIIGGRGTGKSTILDYLRWALCDQAAEAGDDELANPSVRRQRLIDATLLSVGGQVEVSFTINEIPHVVRRSASASDILLKVGGADFVKVREADIRSLLPVHAYSQKQLSSVALRVDELVRFVTAPIQQPLDDLDGRVVEIAGRLRENYATLQRVRDVQDGIARARLLEASQAEQATNLRTSLTNLSDEDRTILNRKPGVDAVREKLATEASDFDEVTASGDGLLESVRATLVAFDAPLAAPEELAPPVAEVRNQRRALLIEIERSLAGALAVVELGRSAGSAEHTASAAMSGLLDDFDATYEVVKGRSSTHEAKLLELAQIEERRKNAAGQVQRLERDLKTLGDPAAIHADLRTQLVAALEERSGLLANECTGLTALSGGLLRATLNRGRGLDAVEEKFKSLIQGSGVRSSRTEALFAQLRRETDLISTWEDVLNELEGLLLLGDEGDHTSQVTPTLTRLAFPLPDQQRIRPQLSPDGWLDLALTPVKDEPLFEYQTKEGEFIAFSSASAGQQATALLRILLSQTGMPLIVDQPEEDLDSQVIESVVEQIWEAKHGRQVIFASHNANLVVNGDAELVVAFDYRKAGDQSGGRIKLQGAIDVPAVCEEITLVMEGGEKAFRLRKEKYGY